MLRAAVKPAALVLIGLIVGGAVGYSTHRPSQPKPAPPPAGFQDMIIDGSGKVSYTHEFAFSNVGHCIVFADQYEQHQMVCGNFKVMGTASLRSD